MIPQQATMMAWIVIYRNIKQYGVKYPEGPCNFSVLSLDIRNSDGHIANGCLMPVLLEKAKDTLIDGGERAN